MISKQDIVTFANHLVHRQKGAVSHRMFHPVRDWYIGIVVTVCLGTAGAAYASDLFFTELRTGGAGMEETVTGSDRYDRTEVERALEVYRTRAEEFDALRGDAPAFVPQDTQPTEPVGGPVRAE